MRAVYLSVLVLALGAPAVSAADVTFTGVVVNTCTLVATPGVLGLSTDGTKLSSTIGSGVSGEVAIVSLGINTITVGTPSMTTWPSGYNSAGQVVRVAYHGLNLLSSVIQALTGTTTTFDIGILPLTVLRVDNEVTNSNGFVQGTYQTTTVVTCS